MIAHLKGTVSAKNDNSAIIDVGGVGYGVNLPQSDLEQLLIDETVKIHTYLAIRENSQDLYGFMNLAAKELFEQLIGVNGIGPKAGLAILSLGDVDSIKHAITDGNVAYITSAQGIGKKGAEKVILDLKDKVTPGAGSSASSANVMTDDAAAALSALGYSAQQIQGALSNVDSKLPVEDRVKQALKEMAG